MGQGRSRVKRTPWPRGIQRPSEDRVLAPRAKTESKNCSWDTLLLRTKKQERPKGPFLLQKSASKPGGWMMEVWSARFGLPQINPKTLCPGRRQAIMQSPSETGNAGHLWGMLTKSLTVYNLWEDQGTATSFQASLTTVSQETGFSPSHNTRKYSATSLNKHSLFYQTAPWRLPTALTKGTSDVMFDTIAQSLGGAAPSDCQISLGP